MAILNNNRAISYSSDLKKWRISVKGKAMNIDDTVPLTEAIFLLPALVNELEEVVQLVHKEIEVQQLSPMVYSTSHFQEIISLALNSQSNYWVSRGLNWLTEKDI